MNMESITGRVATDPMARVTRSGVTTAQFFIQDEQSAYYHVVSYSSLAESVGAFLKTGAVVKIRGKFKTEGWIDHNDIKHLQTRILAIRIEILESKATKDVEQVSA